MNFATNGIESAVLGHSLMQPETQRYLLENYRAKRYREVSHLELEAGEVWLFDYGVAVFWGVDENVKQGILNQIDSFVIEPSVLVEHEQYTFEVSGTPLKMYEDRVFLESDDEQVRLAISHALAQSVKLALFEDVAQRVIQENAYIPKSLAVDGNIPLRRKALAKLRGQLFSTKSDILLNFNLLDTPEFFWDYPELEPHYLLVSRYLDIIPRINVLNKKLETIHDLLEMLANEQNHRHSSMLEWIIIVLIAVDIVLYFWH